MDFHTFPPPRLTKFLEIFTGLIQRLDIWKKSDKAGFIFHLL